MVMQQGTPRCLRLFPRDEKHLLAKYIADTSQPDQLLQTYTGNYYCPELDCKYGIALKDHHLILTNNKYLWIPG